MGASSTGQGPASVRFAPYIEELQEFFAAACLRYGAPEDIIDLTERLDSSQPFTEDLSSMIRSIMLREGGDLQHSQLLEIVALAIGGPQMDHDAQHFAQPLRSLLTFLSGVMRKPWNEPPAEKQHRVERGEVVPFPTRRPHVGMGQSAAIAAAADRAAHGGTDRFSIARIDEAHAEALRFHALRPDAVHMIPAGSYARVEPLSAPSDPPSEWEVPDPETPSEVEDRQAIEERQAVGDQDSPPEDGGAANDFEPVHEQVAPAEVVSQQTQPAPAPTPIAARAGTPSWQLAAQAVRVGAVAGASAEAAVPTPAPVSGETTRGEVPAPTPSISAVIHAASQRNAVPVAATAAEAVRPSFTPRVPRTPAGILVAVAAVLVLAGVFAASLHRAPELVGKQLADSAPPPSQTDAVPAQPVPPKRVPTSASTDSAAVASAAAARVRRVPVNADDEDADDRGVAPPYVTPIPGQQAVPKPSPYVAPAGQQPVQSARPPANEVASTGPVPVPPPSGSSRSLPVQSYTGGGEAGYRPEIHAYRDPDGAIAGDLPRPSHGARVVVERPDYVDVSSGMMAGNLVSAPVPDYPKLAKIAHIGGPVVLQAVIAKNGSVLATHVLSGHRLLRGAAQDAVRRWRYRPYVMDGHPVEVSTIVTVRFKPTG